MRTISIIFIIFLAFSRLCSFTLEDHPSKSYTIALGKHPTPSEEKAAKFLHSHLKQIFASAHFLIQPEDTLAKPAAIYVGKTLKVQSQGIDVSKLEREEMHIQVKGKQLILSGGRQRGSLYAVFEFLETYCGVHYLANDTVLIPHCNKLTLPDLTIRRKPYFQYRIVVPDPCIFRNVLLFNKYNYYRISNRENGYYESYGRPADCHSLGRYSRSFPIDRPNLFAQDRSGKRLVPMKQGDSAPLCLSNPETLNRIWEQMSVLIDRNQRWANEQGCAPSTTYDVSLDDNLLQCHCPICKNIVKTEGSYSGVVLSAVNNLAARLKAKDPNLWISFIVYQNTLFPPRNLRPLDNVIPRICAHDTEWVVNVLAETIRPIKGHPENKQFFDVTETWRNISSRVAFWDYWCYYTKPVFPYVSLDKCFSNLAYFKECNAQSVLIEMEHYEAPFFALRQYIALKLMDNPDMNREKLLKTFMQGYYGDAAPAMTRYRDFLDKAIQEEKTPLGPRFPKHYTYLSPDFFLTANRLLDHAEQDAKTSPQALKHVGFERISLDYGLLLFWEEYAKHMPFDKKLLLKRLFQNHSSMITTHVMPSTQASELQKLKRYIDGQRIVAPLPANIKKRTVFDYKWNSFMVDNRHTRLIPMDDAIGGKAVEIFTSAKNKNAPKFYEIPFTAGVYNVLTKEFGVNYKLTNIPQDEKFHLYKIGSWKMTKGNRIWLHWTWLFQFVPAEAFMPTPDYLHDIHISLKFTGPAFVHGSKLPNRILVDRIIVSRD